MPGPGSATHQSPYFDMNGPGGKTGRKHTPIVSKKQRGKFGAELHRRRVGLAPQIKSITIEELEDHLRESKGKKLPKRSKKK